MEAIISEKSLSLPSSGIQRFQYLCPANIAPPLGLIGRMEATPKITQDSGRKHSTTRQRKKLTSGTLAIHLYVFGYMLLE